MRLVIAIAVVACWFAPARADREINTLIGDASWAGRTEPADEVTRIRAHLGFVHAMLADRDVSQLTPAQRDARATSLSHLARYIERGEFPRRTNDGYEGRRPRFIDDRGVRCAVGQLIADSAVDRRSSPSGSTWISGHRNSSSRRRSRAGSSRVRRALARSRARPRST